MELSVSLSNLRQSLIEKMTIEEQQNFEVYFSIDQENDLVLRALNILKDAKLRKSGKSSLPMKEKIIKKKHWQAPGAVKGQTVEVLPNPLEKFKKVHQLKKMKE